MHSRKLGAQFSSACSRFVSVNGIRRAFAIPTFVSNLEHNNARAFLLQFKLRTFDVLQYWHVFEVPVARRFTPGHIETVIALTPHSPGQRQKRRVTRSKAIGWLTFVLRLGLSALSLFG